MARCTNICCSLILAAVIAPATWLCAQTKSKAHMKKQPKTSVGIRFEGAIKTNTIQNYDKQHSLLYGPKGSVFVKKSITNRIEAEVKVSYSAYLNDCCIEQILGGKMKGFSSSIEIPVTLQYSLLPARHKVQPFLGVGVQYGIDKNNVEQNVVIQDASTYLVRDRNPEKKYISILFAQGVTFEVSTRIQLTESIHFIPERDQSLGIDIGIGYRIR